jgi:hypothetical protein
MFYQTVLYHFGQLRSIALEPPLAVFDLVRIALDFPESSYKEEDGPKDEIAQVTIQ